MSRSIPVLRLFLLAFILLDTTRSTARATDFPRTVHSEWRKRSITLENAFVAIEIGQ